jgi:hypothetical protein
VKTIGWENIHIWDRKHFLFISLTFKRAELICSVYISIERKFQKSTRGKRRGEKRKRKKESEEKLGLVFLILDL